ncbi:MAG TPA: hypothetical protein VH518_12820 [Tepidisphaeraceae bacterium]
MTHAIITYAGVAATYNSDGSVDNPGTVITDTDSTDHYAFGIGSSVDHSAKSDITIQGLTFDDCGVASLDAFVDHLIITGNLVQNDVVHSGNTPDWNGTGAIKVTYGLSNSSISSNVFKHNRIFCGIYFINGDGTAPLYNIVNINSNTFSDCNGGIQGVLSTSYDNANIHVDSNKGIGIINKLIEIVGANNSQGKVNGLSISGNMASGFVNHFDGTMGISAPISGPDVLGMVVNDNEISDIPDQGTSESDSQHPGVRIGLEVGGRTGQSSGFGVTIEGNKLYGMVTPISLTGGVKDARVISADKDIVFWRSGQEVDGNGVHIDNTYLGTYNDDDATVAYPDLPDTLPADTNVAFDAWATGTTNSADAFQVLSDGTIKRDGSPVGAIPDTSGIDGLAPGRAVIGGQGGDDTYDVDGGSVVLVSPKLHSLDIASGARVRVAGHHAANSAAGTVKIAPEDLTIAVGGVLDLDNNAMVINSNTLDTLITTVRGYLHDGRLTTTSNYAPNTRVGYMKNTDVYPQRTTFAGVSVDSTSLLIKYTYAGDSDFDGDADGVDIGNWATGFTGELGGMDATKTWHQGDWDYDGDVDGVDAGLWAVAFTGELGGGGLRPGGGEGGGGEASDDLQGGREAIGPVEVDGPVDPDAIAILQDIANSSVPELYDVAWLWA